MVLCAEMLKQLIKGIQANESKSDTNSSATDNMISAIGRMAHYQNMPKLYPVFLNFLPLQCDKVGWSFIVLAVVSAALADLCSLSSCFLLCRARLTLATTCCARWSSPTTRRCWARTTAICPRLSSESSSVCL